MSAMPCWKQKKAWVHMFHSHDPRMCHVTQCPDPQEWQCLPWSKPRCWQCVQTLSTSFSQRSADWGCSHIDDIRILLLIYAMYSKCTELLACCWWASLGGHSYHPPAFPEFFNVFLSCLNFLLSHSGQSQYLAVHWKPITGVWEEIGTFQELSDG